MTTAFIAEIDTDEGTRYLSSKSKLSTVPLFFRTASHLRRALTGNKYRMSKDYFVPSRDNLKTVVVKVDMLERGLRSSHGTKMSVHEFNALPSKGKTPSISSNVVFKIQLNSQKVKKFVGDGKFGKTWNRQGDIRNHITANIHRLTAAYKDANVLQITIGPDGVSPTSITYTPIVEWYRRSPYGNITYLKNFGESMTSNDLSSLVPRSLYA